MSSDVAVGFLIEQLIYGAACLVLSICWALQLASEWTIHASKRRKVRNLNGIASDQLRVLRRPSANFGLYIAD